MLYLISPILALRADPVLEWLKIFKNPPVFEYSDVPFLCSIHNLSNLNESFNSCQKMYDPTGYIAQSVLALSDLALDILDGNLTLLPNLIEQTPNTTTCTMEDLNLTSVNSEAISKWKHLKSLSVSYNKIKILPNHFLSGCQRLHSLSISNNEIIEMELEAFAGLSSLTTLYLSSNHIGILNPNVFKPLINLKGLSLANNRIRKVDSNLFCNNVKLDWLNLSHNNLRNVELQAVNKLQELYISHNPMVNINLRYMDSLKLLNITNCSLKTLFVPLRIRFLYAYNNQISHITTEPNSKLLSLRIGSNNLDDSVDLRSFVNLRVLDLSNNNITKLNFNNFLGLNKLLSLQLNFIRVKDINIIEMMKTLPALQQFNVSSINLSTEKSMRIQQNAEKIGIPIEIHHDEGTNLITLIKNGDVGKYFYEILNVFSF